MNLVYANLAQFLILRYFLDVEKKMIFFFLSLSRDVKIFFVNLDNQNC
mgnify:CR=1 FL=1